MGDPSKMFEIICDKYYKQQLIYDSIILDTGYMRSDP